MFGYPVLGAALFAAAAGVPLPSALTVVAAGALAEEGHLDWLTTSMVALVASVGGDLVAYQIGRYAGREAMVWGGTWVGLTPAVLLRGEVLFGRWGGIGILLSRSLLSALCIAVSLLAGIGRYRLGQYILFDVVGRVVWIAGYLGFGYHFGNDIEEAATLAGDVSGLLGSIAFVVIALVLIVRRQRSTVARVPATRQQ